jgi:two-component system chemotaxis response regulator CheY
MTCAVRLVVPLDHSPARILIIDADRSSRRALASLLEEVGHRVGHAPTWQAGLALARAGRFDLVVADLEPPAVGPGDGLAALAAESSLRDVPIILLSRRRVASVQRALVPGVVESMTKPIDVRRMLSSIESHVQSGSR